MMLTPGTLRYGIANASPGDTITFMPGLMSPIVLMQGSIDLNKNLTITGPGASTLAISAGFNSRIFTVEPFVTVTISGLTLEDGEVFSGTDNTVHTLLGNGDGTLQAPSGLGTGRHPDAVATADLNRDGIPDLIIANEADNNVSVLLGNGNGTFQPAVNYAVGSGLTSVAVADLRHDGKLDLVVTNGLDNSVSVLLGNGDGSFRPAVNYHVGTTPVAVKVADFNHDGRLDLAVANEGSDNVSILLGNGNGTFRRAVNYAAGPGPTALAVAGFTHDGNLDLAVTDAGGAGNFVSVLLGNGNGTFRAPRSFTVGSHPDAIVAADVNGDGRPDLIVANFSDNTVSVLLSGSGEVERELNDDEGLLFRPAVNYAVGAGPDGLALADVNGDGKLDLIVANYADNNVSVLLGNGNGTFGPQHTFDAGPHPSAVAAADINRDGKPDVVVTNLAGSQIGDGGGAILNLGNLTVTNSVFDTNDAVRGYGGSVAPAAGGAILCGGSIGIPNLTLINDTFQNNKADDFGGAIAADAPSILTITGCTLHDNAALHGGDVASIGTLTVNQSYFYITPMIPVSPPSGMVQGTQMWLSGSSPQLVENDTFCGASAVLVPGTGGAIFNQGTNVVLENDTIDGSFASVGGGIFNAMNAMMTIKSCTITGNYAQNSSMGGGIYNDMNSHLLLRNTILTGNSSGLPNPDDISGQGSIDPSSDYNLIGQPNVTLLGLHNIIIGLSDPHLGPLQNNGGPTPTMALLALSPALNAGDPGQLGTADQRGVVRRGGVNIGAYQASASVIVLTPLSIIHAGVPFALRIEAQDQFGQRAVGYTGTVRFILNGVTMRDFTFPPTDYGVHTANVTIQQNLHITGYDLSDPTIVVQPIDLTVQ
jgi:predicted outer membrane repeat protein